MTAPEDRQFTITRTYDAPVDAVWRAWTQTPALHTWLNSSDVLTPLESVKSDLRVGGRYTYTTVVPHRGTFPTAGIFLDITPHERLQFTWGNPEDSEKHYPVITVELLDAQDKTELTFHLSGARADRGSERSVYDMWNEALARLADYLQP